MAGLKQPTSKQYKIFVSIAILTFAGFIAYIYPEVISLISIMGGICCVSIVITFPGMVFVKLIGEKGTNWKVWVGINITSLLTLVGYTAATLSILSIFGIVDLDPPDMKNITL